MSDNKQQPQAQQPDPALDVPADANTEKHMNYTAEAEDGDSTSGADDRDNPRRQQWAQGLADGRRAEGDDQRPGNDEDSTVGIP